MECEPDVVACGIAGGAFESDDLGGVGLKIGDDACTNDSDGDPFTGGR